MKTPADTHTTLGDRIRSARKRTGLTQAQAAEALESTQGYWANMENGRKATTLETILRVAQALDCDPHELDPRLASNRNKRRA